MKLQAMLKADAKEMLGQCQLATDPRVRKRLIKRIEKLEEGKVPGGTNWKFAGRTAQIAKPKFKGVKK